MRYASVCSGIEAATVAWKPLGWRAAFYSEIEKFPCAVLAHHYPNTPNLGDMTRITDDQIAEHGKIDLLVGGTPCQSFSVAGLRKGMDDPRGNLALVYLRLADRLRPRWIVWENVPGVLSSGKGRDFGAFLGAMGQLGYGFAYRVLDAQFFGVPQRRRRVFVVGYLGDWRAAAAVFFDRESLLGNPPPSRQARTPVARSLTASTGGCSAKEHSEEVAGPLCPGAHPCGFNGQDAHSGHLVSAFGGNNTAGEIDVATAVNANDRYDFESETFVAAQCHGENVGPMGTLRASDGVGNGVPFIAECYRTSGNCGVMTQGDRSAALTTQTDPNAQILHQAAMTVRRLTPRECERLQGFPDDYTNIPYGRPRHPDQLCPDGPRYRALGNSMAVPVMRWIGERIEAVEMILQAKLELAT